MAKAEITATITRPRDDVFACLMDLDNRIHWVGGLVEVKHLSDGPMAVGKRWAEIGTVMGQWTEVAFKLTEYEPSARFAQSIVSGPITGTMAATLEAEGDGTKLHFVLEGEGKGMGGRLVLRPMIEMLKRQIRGDMERLQAYMESRR